MGDTSYFKLTTSFHFFFKFLFFVLAVSITSKAQDSQTREKARYYHNLYNKYYSQEITNFDEVVKSNAVDKSYVVQDGDTLYGLSDAFFGSSEFWPKVWSINPELKNPHLIYKGRVITFTGGSVEDAPDIIVGSGNADTSIIQKGLLKGTTSTTPEGAIKAARAIKEKTGYIGKPPIVLPASLPSFATLINFQKKELETLGSIDANVRDAYMDGLVFKPRSEITTKVVKSEGVIQGIFRGGNNASLGETVILKSKKGLNIGENLVAFKSVPFKGMKSKVGKKVYVMERTGTLRVDKSLGKSRYLAEVIESFNFVEKNNNFYVGKIKDIIIERDEVPTALVTDKEVVILGGEKGFSRQVLGTGDLVYLNKGLNANLQLGQMYLVYTNRSQKVSEPGVKYAKNLPVSLAKIVAIENLVATAILVDNVGEVSKGDYLNIRERK